jgi:hypothetical protein
MRLPLIPNLAALALLAASISSEAQSSSFTYQGRLDLNGVPANGIFDLTFALFPSSAGGTPVPSPQTNSAVAIHNGVFTVTIGSLASGLFNGSSYWLEISVRTNGVGPFSALAPRQPITRAPHASFADAASAAGLIGTLPASSLGGTYGTPVTISNAANTFGGSFTGNGAGLSNVNARMLNGLSSASFWKTNGNSGANPTNGVFLGNADALPLEIKVGGARAFRFEYATDTLYGGATPNLIGGHPGNVVSNGFIGAAVLGGGNATYPNRVGKSYATVVGGRGNTASGLAATAMGDGVTASGSAATAMGSGTVASSDAAMATGIGTTASGLYSTAMGINTRASGDFSTALTADSVASGARASAMGAGALAAGGGSVALGGSRAIGEYSTAMGLNSAASNSYSVAMGIGSVASGLASFASGATNTAQGNYSTALGNGTVASNLSATALGSRTTASGQYATAMGLNTVASGLYSTAMGRSTLANNDDAVAMGYGCQASGWDSTAMGSLTKAIGHYSTAMGRSTTASADDAVAMGFGSTASGWDSLATGNHTVAGGHYSTAMGYYSQANHQGAFVWADTASATPFTSAANNEFAVRAAGGVRFASSYMLISGGGNEQAYMGGDGTGGDVEIGSRNAGVMNVGFWNAAAFSHMNVFGLTFNPGSDRNIKQDFKPVDAAAILSKVLALPVTEWAYKADAQTRHLGPIAQDFQAAFGLGASDKSIATVDADGVALAAIQGLHQKLETETATLRTENAELLRRIAALEKLISDLAPQRTTP